MSDFTWTGPFGVANLSQRSMADAQPMPPGANGLYLVTRRRWERNPTSRRPLDVGGQQDRSCAREGEGELILATHYLSEKHSGRPAYMRGATQAVEPSKGWRDLPQAAPTDRAGVREDALPGDDGCGIAAG